MHRALVSATLLASAAPLSAQTTRIRVIEAETGRNISGAIVVLQDSSGQRLFQALTDDLGRITFQAPRPGTYRLKADRIGHPGVVTPFFDVPGDVNRMLEMPAVRVVLPDVAVAASSVCGRREDSEETAKLWEEIRKALAASQITASSETVELAVRRFLRYRSFAGTLRTDSTTRTFTTRLSPFVTADPASLSESGYIQGKDGQFRFFGPDATLLLSDEFLTDHCFHVARPGREAPAAMGLAFQPVKGRKLPDIRGTLWVDRGTAELRTLEFEYVNVPASVRVEGLGGEIEFQRLQGGGWIIRDWHIRMPDRVTLQRGRRSGGQAFQRDTVLGFVDDGGTARPLGDPSVHLTDAVLRARRVSTVFYDVSARVMSSSGAPIEAALVAVAGLDTLVRSDARGQFRLSDLPEGPLRLRLRAIGHSPLAVEIVLSGDRRQVDTTLTMKAVAQQLDPIVVNENALPFAHNKMEGFERRRKEGFGRFLTMEELHDPLRGSLDLQLRRFGRIDLARVSCVSGYSAAALGLSAPPGSRASCSEYPIVIDRCFMTVYLDGALYYSADMPGPPLDISKFNLLTLQAVEVYRSPAEMPVEYNATNSACGVILLWTR